MMKPKMPRPQVSDAKVRKPHVSRPKPTRGQTVGSKKAKFTGVTASIGKRKTQGISHVPTVKTKNAPSLNYLRSKAVRQSRRDEIKLVQQTEKGTRKWTNTQMAQLKKGHWPRNIQGHHIRSVKGHSKKWVSDPRNIKFVTPREHLKEHKGHWANKTSGKLIDRQAMIRQNVLKKR